MTKKFWKDWQKRIGETYSIDLFNSVKVGEKLYNRWNLLSHLYADDKIIEAKFNGDTVDLLIEKHSWVFGKGINSGHLHTENLYVTLERTNIKNIEFNRKL